MTVFTKKDATEEKNTSDKEVPKVVVSGSLSPNSPPDERHISNCGWVPMEGGNFDRPKEKRSSSFGPLSIIRLSPSPLARTPSPSPPDYDSVDPERRFRKCTKVMLLLCILMGVGMGTGFFFYQKSLINAAYKKGIYHGWNAAVYNNRGVPEKLEQNVEVNQDQAYEKIDVPRFGSNRPAVFLHDFKQNLTAIVDVMGKRCFVKQLDRSTVAAPRNIIEMLRGMESSSNPSSVSRVVRETFRVGEQLNEEQLDSLGSFVITRHCQYRPVYMLQKTGDAQDARRFRRASETLESLDFASMGGDAVEVDTIEF
ncbi:unnamed protein product [Auanema sp. JU1783]|nr:unnamed protein product [Auanema sp. JU1783]